jgi:hypothetical chaperone protein
MQRNVGLDFGTTNSAIGVAAENGAVTLARFAHRGGSSETFRSILHFNPEQRDARNRIKPTAGPGAIDDYLDAGGIGRLIQSLKSYLADRSFESTDIWGRAHTLNDLLALLLIDLRRAAEAELGPLGDRIVVGRPVHFSSAESADDDAFAEGRLRAAIMSAGWKEIAFEYEPVAAASYYEATLDHDELVLVADFGGGTSDFSLLSVGPSALVDGKRLIFGNDGVGLAGDALDAKLLHHLVAPALGLGSSYRSMFGKVLEVPVWIYGKLRRWHHLSFLKTKRTMAMLEEIHDQAIDPKAIGALLHVLESDLGYHLYRAVERTKVELSSNQASRFLFEDGPISIDRPVTRVELESWIEEETTAIAACVDRLLDRTGASARDVDQVFMTGGSSFVPAVRRIFEQRFGVSKIRAGGEMISVASGLALRARDP